MNISEISKMYGMTKDTLRYYERIGLIPPVPRRTNGIRNYDEASRGWIEFIHCMRRAGLSVEVLTEYVRLCQEGSSTEELRRQLLIKERERLDERIMQMQEIKARLDYKIARYEKINAAAKRLEKYTDKTSSGEVCEGSVGAI